MFSLKLKRTTPHAAVSINAETPTPRASANSPSTSATPEEQRLSSSRRPRRSRRHSANGGSSSHDIVNRRQRSSGSVIKKDIPPASNVAIEGLLHLRLRAEDSKSLSEACPNEECVICAERFANKDVVTTLPCGHMHHSDCIVNWLSRKCTCPTCRYEMPTDDKSFEHRRVRREAEKADHNQNGDGPSSEDDSENIYCTPGLLLFQGMEDVIAMKRHDYFFCQNQENFDLIVRRTLRMKEDAERDRALEARRKALEKQSRSLDDHVTNIATEPEIRSDTPLDHAHFLELYA
ncbi:ring finger domain containing protein [Nitzschia inconspicua]|uniref:Ring finger domain containing protein n=1 Tax=Nitzschia inconspicua TaxID=303405 RepID=A0A9K3LGV4_9STRA|nr:ring finger domain containing protein [Nitzschia inconspicua]